jgi:Flp pilus assembly protein TadG
MKQRSNQRGVAIVEMAITLIPFLVFLFAVIEGGWFFYVQLTLTNAAREGAKMGVRPSSGTDTLMSDTDIKDYMAPYLSAIGVNCPSCITISHPTVGGQTRTQVVVQITYSPITLSMFNRLAFPIKGQAVMRNETSGP